MIRKAIIVVLTLGTFSVTAISLLSYGTPLRSEWTQIQVWAWMVVAAFAAYPMLVFIRGPLRRWRRHRKGLCIRCGYNLEGNVSGACSECGEAI